MINEDYECVEKFVKARALYLPTKHLEDSVPGTLLITPNAVMFDPKAVAEMVEKETAEHGCQLSPKSSSVSSAGLPPGDLLLPMSWIATVSIFRQIPGVELSAGRRGRIESSPGVNLKSVPSITECAEDVVGDRDAESTSSSIAISSGITVPPEVQGTECSSSLTNSNLEKTASLKSVSEVHINADLYINYLVYMVPCYRLLERLVPH